MLRNRNFPLDPAGGAYSAPSDPVTNGEGLAALATNPTSTLGPSGLVSMGLEV